MITPIKNQAFTIEGGIDFDKTIPLTELLIAVRHQRPFINIQGKKWLLLNDELRRRLLILADTIQPKQQNLFISQQHIPLIDEILPDIEKPDEWKNKILLFKQPKPCASPEIHAQLRPYQKIGYEWLFNLSQWSPGACLADDMGLGKTIQTLAFISTRPGPFLVVGPTSLAMNWFYETRKFSPKLDPILYKGENRKNILLVLRQNSLIITSYSILSRDIDSLKKIDFSVCILDEAQAVKNPQTARTQAARALNAKFMLTLTGTPIENNLLDLWSLFSVSNPGLLGSQSQFFKRFVQENRREALSQVIAPFILRRLKHHVAPELPERIEIEEYVNLSLSERELYNKNHLALLSKLNITQPEQRFQMLAALTRLRQLACHPRLIDPSYIGSSSKIERCIDMILQMKAMNRKVLVFSQFVRLLQFLKSRLEQENISYSYLDGGMKIEKREAEIQKFKSTDTSCFLLSLKAGGSGLNLTQASEVILLDPWWNPAVEAQAADRSHRIGQKHQVSIYRLISRDTIESGIIKLHQHKREIASQLLQDSDSILSFEQIKDIITNLDNVLIEKTAEKTLALNAQKSENKNE